MVPLYTSILLELHRRDRRRSERRKAARVTAMAAALAYLLVLGVDFLTTPNCAYPKSFSARDEARSYYRAVEQFQATHADRCPNDLDELVTAGVVARPQVDPWGRPYLLSCTRERIIVCSSGPERARPGDDICAAE